MDLTEAVAKVREGMPIDDDYGLPIRAGVLPGQTTVLGPLSNPRNLLDLEAPHYRVSITSPGRGRGGRMAARRACSILRT